MPIRSQHAPHYSTGLLEMRFFPGRILEPQSSPPRTVIGWKEGETWAFLIDLLDRDSEAIFRIHYQDSASPSSSRLRQDTAVA